MTLSGSSLNSRQVYLPRKQCLIKRNRHRHVTTKAWTAIDRLLVIYKSDLMDEIKRSIFPATFVSILLYACTTWTLIKRIEKKPSIMKLSKLNEPDMQDTAGEVETNA